MPAFLPQEVIKAKRDGLPLPDDAIAAFLAGISNGTISEGQAAALAMAIYFNGMNQVLGHTAGNALEVGEAVAYLTGARRRAHASRSNDRSQRRLQ